MKLKQVFLAESAEWKTIKNETDSPSVALAFSDREKLSDETYINEIKEMFPDCPVLFGSTSGEICEDSVYDNSIVVTGIEFEKTKLITKQVNISNYNSSYDAGKALGNAFQSEDLKHLFVLSDGHHVNGSQLVKGLKDAIPNPVSLTGGLCGDAARFEKTLVGFDVPEEGNICAIGFYGNSIQVGYGSMGGWDSFGPERRVTKSENNVLYELDGKSALDLYKEYLGEQAKGLPGTGLLFPLSLKINEEDTPLVRTILDVNEEEKSMTFAGDLPEGAWVRLMKANFDRLIDGASVAATRGLVQSDNSKVAVLISCVGRKLVLGQRIDEEVESAREVLGEDTLFTGFYSYGEISPFTPSATCELHNQTMTITIFSEG
mgnify:CR=1 FL=1